jgi:hypothetical protein
LDDPAKTYGTCTLSTTFEGALAETCLRAVGARFIAVTFLESRSFPEIEVTAPLTLVSVHGPGLAQIGATGAVTSGPHAVAQQMVSSHPRSSECATRHRLSLEP